MREAKSVMPGRLPSGVGEQSLGRGSTRRAGDAPRRAGAGAGDVQAPDRRAMATELAGGAEEAELVEAQVEVHGMGAGPAAAPLHLVGGVGGGAHDARAKARRPVL